MSPNLTDYRLIMWFTLLVMAAAVSLEPFRVGMTVLMLNRPRPLLHLLSFLTGGFAMGLMVGVIVLFVLRPVLGTTHFNVPSVQIVVGALVLVAAAVLVMRKPGGEATGKAGGKARAMMGPRAKQLLNGDSLWTAGVAGLGIALPSLDYLAVLALIVASGAAAATQVGALLLFNVVAFTLVEIPLISYLVAPERTRTSLTALHDWLRSRGRLGIAALLAAIGCVLLGAGVAGL